MEYAKKSLSLLSPKSLSKCVYVSATMTQQFLTRPVSKPRPFRVCNCDRSIRKGIVADSLEDLLNKTQDGLLMGEAITLVLEEDGTGVDTEDFFQSLDSGAVFMALGKGQKWKPSHNAGYHICLTNKPQRKVDVARISFDLYKNDPQDFIGCLNVKATLYGTYSVSYDLQCYSAKRIMKEALRWTLFTMQATGHVLLGTSCYMQQIMEPSNNTVPEEEKPSAALRDFIPFYSRRMLQ
ncbi:lipid transferase CIDEC isoform X2 [Hyla sarda]|nr:lipid transferase CIDEC isoform X2 [Hyla sarda]XP_056380694.1 lipid transferase CIDEC isoform X2 [Hyla sarda]XP_056380695.1 lipid transferase CIDEC isoform X2 [Hyla sarda]XP_056380697.1 lipid transferase CIDEC isoform X2 [Hyla sarda]